MEDDGWAGQRLVSREDLFDVEVDGSQVVYDPIAGKAHVLDGAAATIWAMLAEPASMEGLTDRVVAATGLDEARVRRDVADAIACLSAQQLVVDARAANGAPNTERRASSTPVSDDVPRAEWSTGPLALLDRRVAVVSPTAAHAAAVEWYTAPLRVGGSAGEVVALHAEPAFERTLPARLNRVAAASTSCVALHAAGVVAGSVGVLLPGAPESGKSTSSAAMTERGWGYLSDELVGVGDDLTLCGFPKRIALELGSWPLFPGVEGQADATRDGFDTSRVRWVDPRTLNDRALAWMDAPQPPRAGLCVVASFQNGSELRVRRLAPVEALAALLANNMNLARCGRAGLVTLRRIALEVPCYEVHHGGLDHVLPALHELAVEAGLDVPG